VNEDYTSRKFWIVLGTLCTATVLVWAGKIDSVTYGNILQWVVAAYVTANVAEKRLLK
jgi:amino acid permease